MKLFLLVWTSGGRAMQGRYRRTLRRARRGAVLATARALTQVAAEAAPPQGRPAPGRQLPADLRAVDLARGAIGQQRLSSLEDQRLDLGWRDVEQRGDLGMAPRVDLRHHERRTLGGRQSPQIGDDVAEVLAALDDRRQP